MNGSNLPKNRPIVQIQTSCTKQIPVHATEDCFGQRVVTMNLLRTPQMHQHSTGK
jgi:hypothetical protein